MIYLPSNGKLWDTWIFLHPDTGDFHLFYLVRHKIHASVPCLHIDHAVSTNLIDWHALERITPTGGPIGTGMVIQDGSRFYMTYTDQGIHFLQPQDSTNLTGWQPVPEFFIPPPNDTSHYITSAMPLSKKEPDFRDAYIIKKDGIFHAFIGASRPDTPVGGMGCVAYAVSPDLRTWQFLPPVTEPVGLYQMEVPDYHEIGGRYYLFVSDMANGIRYDDSLRTRSGGTFYLMSDRINGSYHMPSNGLILGGKGSVYVGRVLACNGEHLMYFHHTDGALGLPKRIEQAADGTLTLVVWTEGISRLRKSPWCPGTKLMPVSRGPRTAGTYEEYGIGISASCERGNHCAIWDQVIYDVELSVDIEFGGSEGRAGLVLRYSPAEQIGLVVVADRAHGTVSVERINDSLWHPLVSCYPLDEARFPVNDKVRLQVLARAQYVEVYVDNRWLFSGSFADNLCWGVCGLFIADGSAIFSNLECFSLYPLIPSEVP